MDTLQQTLIANRHAFRAAWHDYNDGIYFVTICTNGKECIFGNIHDNIMIDSDIGEIVRQCVRDIPLHHPNAELWNYTVMPNHIHMIIAIKQKSAGICNTGCVNSDTKAVLHHNSALAVIVGTLKAAVTRIVNQRIRNLSTGIYNRNMPPRQKIWQRLYHEHIIRNQQSFENIMNYINNNVYNWYTDCFHHR